MLVKDLIKIFRDEWIPGTDLLKTLDRSAEVTRHMIESLGDAKLLEYYDSMPLWPIRGIGPAKARELWAAGVRPGNLARHKRLLPESTLLALEYNPMSKIPHDLVTEIAAKFIPPDEKKRCEIVGSYRRLKPTSGDVDILYWGPDLQKFLDKLAAQHGSRWILFAQGPSKIAGIFKYSPTRAVEVDLWIADSETYPAMLLYSTGSKEFNVRMRYIAKYRGYKLNQYGLWDLKTGKKVPGLKTERDIFRALEMKYRAPPLR